MNTYSLQNDYNNDQNKNKIAHIVCQGPNQIFDVYDFPFHNLKLQSGSYPRSSKGWPIRAGHIDKGTYHLDRNKPIELAGDSTIIAKAINEIIPEQLFEEEYSPSYKKNTPEDLFYIAVDLKSRESITPSKIDLLYTTLGFKKNIKPRPKGLQIICHKKELFPTIQRIKKLIIPIDAYENIMHLPQKILIRLKEFITNAYYKYTGWDELITGGFTRADELNKWIIKSDSDSEVSNWIIKNNLCNILYYKKAFSDNKYHPEIYTMINPNIESIWTKIKPIKEKNSAIINKLYAYLEVLTIWEAFRTINKIQRTYCSKIPSENK